MLFGINTIFHVQVGLVAEHAFNHKHLIPVSLHINKWIISTFLFLTQNKTVSYLHSCLSKASKAINFAQWYNKGINNAIAKKLKPKISAKNYLKSRGSSLMASVKRSIASL